MKKLLFFGLILISSSCINLDVEQEDSSLQIYPNPVSDQFFIYSGEAGTIKVLGTNGDLVLENTIESQTTITVQVADEQEGILYVEFENNNVKYRKPVIKQ